MVRSVVAEETILPYLTRLTRQEGYDIGLILGQTTENRDYVIHLARTPRTSSKGPKDESPDPFQPESASNVEPCIIKSIAEIQESCVADHAKHVTRMLPGGMFVLGIFIVGPSDVFATDSSVARLCTILARIKKTLTSNRFLHGNSPTSEKLVLHLSSKTHRFVCKMLNPDSAHSTPITIDWKFQSKPTKWHQLDCQFELDQPFPIPIEKVTLPLKKILQDVLTAVSEQIKLAVCTVDGEVRDLSEVIESIGRKKKGKNSPSVAQEEGKLLTASMYIPCDKQVNKENELLVQECCGEMKFQGILASRVFLHQKATIQEAVQALKQDVVRSLASRLEMHWDSLIEEEQGSPEEHVTLHEPPRRVLVPLPHCRVSLSDYLFPGEGPSEALISLEELLDLKVDESDVQKELETQADPSEYYTSDIQIESDASEDLLPVSMSKSTVILIALATAVAILAVYVALHFSEWRESK